jgi:glycerol-3-phosphate acyltransferase PlsX
VFPNLTGLTIMLDFGANADAKPDWLAQFALMGSIYAERGLGIDNPRVALLSNGEEEGKGNQLIHETIPLMRELDINYVGNMEPKEVLRGETDVIVHDGFTGNIMGKTLESMGSMINQLIRQEIRAGVITTIGGLLARPAFRRVGKKVDPFEVGGIPLLGLNGVVIVAHGRSNEVAIKNAIRQARRAVQGNVVSLIREGIANTPTSAPAESS